jgi:hypothetical protein
MTTTIATPHTNPIMQIKNTKQTGRTEFSLPNLDVVEDKINSLTGPSDVSKDAEPTSAVTDSPTAPVVTEGTKEKTPRKRRTQKKNGRKETTTTDTVSNPSDVGKIMNELSNPENKFKSFAELATLSSSTPKVVKAVRDALLDNCEAQTTNNPPEGGLNKNQIKKISDLKSILQTYGIKKDYNVYANEFIKTSLKIK